MTSQTKLFAVGALFLAGCATSSVPTTQMSTGVSPSFGTAIPPSPDPRVGLRAGLTDSAQHITSAAAEAVWNLRVVSRTPVPPAFFGAFNSDLAFLGKYAIQGNYNGTQIWDISNPAKPTLASSYVCPNSQNDVSVYRNLLFVSAEAPTARMDCNRDDRAVRERRRGPVLACRR